MPFTGLGTQVYAIDGAVGVPSLTFGSEPSTGFYRISTGRVGYASAGVLTVSFDNGGGMTVIGGAINLNVNSNFNVSIASGTSQGTILIGNSVAGNITVATGATLTITVVTAMTVTGAAINLNASSNFAVNICSGTSQGLVTIGNSAANSVNITSGAASTFTFSAGLTIVTDATTGLKLGSAATQKVGFYGVVPVVQAAAISAPTGGATVDAEARTAINSIRTALTNMGITA